MIHGLLNSDFRLRGKKKMLDEAAIAVYYYAYMAITNPTETQYFDKLEHLIHEKSAEFSTF